MYLKTLGLRNKKIEVQEQDYYHTPTSPVKLSFINKKGDDLIEWKNNQLEIDYNSEALKQFKIGNKKRYEAAAKDEADNEFWQWYNLQIKQGYYFLGIDYTREIW